MLLNLLLVGCYSSTFQDVESERTKLINGIESYQSVLEFKAFLGRGPLQWEEKIQNDNPKGRPPFNIDTITIKNYSHLGISGELVVTFFNNRLMSTMMIPSDFEEYIKALEKEGIRFDKDQQTKLAPYTRVRFATLFTGQNYIDWSDIRLDKEFDVWIERYS